jgi:transaldolase
MVNVTLCFSPVQAMMAAKAGATFISPFIGRLDDAGQDGMELIHEIRTIYDNYGYDTQILAASIRGIPHVRNSALAGADVATIPIDVFKALLNHPLTDKGLAAFLADAKKAGVRIRDE